MKNFVKEIIKNVLKNSAKKVLRKNKPIIIAVTGSVAKSSTKEAIYQVLHEAGKFGSKVRKSAGNLNTEIGLPLAILGFSRAPRWYQWPMALLITGLRANFSQFNPLKQTSVLVLEYAADKPGDIKYLASIAKPNIAVITALGPAHLGNYQSFNQLIEEKAQLVYALGKHDIAILNRNDSLIKEIAAHSKAEIKYFSADLDEITEQIVRKIAEIFNINQKLVTNVLQNTSRLEHRMNIINLKNLVIVDDTYNANPLSMQFALENLDNLAKKYHAKRKIAVLGDMLELGKESPKYHDKVGKLVQKNTDLLIGIGELAKYYNADQWFADLPSAKKFILENMQKGDIILFKASRGMKLEKLAEEAKRTWNKFLSH